MSGPEAKVLVQVLIVEDDEDIRGSFVDLLSSHGFDVVGVGTGLEFYRTLAIRSFDVVILDLSLPDLDGLDIARTLLQRQDVGVIVLSARGTTADRRQGYEAGADMYFVKPVDGDEIVAAIHSLMRRLRRDEKSGRPDAAMVGGHSSPPRPGTRAGSGEQKWVFDPVRWALLSPDGVSIPLTSTEHRLLAMLMDTPGLPVSREKLLTGLGYDDERTGNRALESLVRRLRVKLTTTLDTPPPIRTAHGQGYVFAGPVEVEDSSKLR